MIEYFASRQACGTPRPARWRGRPSIDPARFLTRTRPMPRPAVPTTNEWMRSAACPAGESRRRSCPGASYGPVADGHESAVRVVQLRAQDVHGERRV